MLLKIEASLLLSSGLVVEKRRFNQIQASHTFFMSRLADKAVMLPDK
jgi:hypothetical protein